MDEGNIQTEVEVIAPEVITIEFDGGNGIGLPSLAEENDINNEREIWNNKEKEYKNTI